MPMKTILALAIGLPLLAQAADHCVLQQRSVAVSQVQIQERSDIRRSITPVGRGETKCSVDFRVRIGNTWHSAFGDYVWSGELPVQQACARAVGVAESDVKARVAAREVSTESLLVCSDDTRHQTLREVKVGTIAPVSRYRPHPDYPAEFWHNGTRCRWILDTVWTGTRILTQNGVVCQLRDDQWVVVDKF